MYRWYVDTNFFYKLIKNTAYTGVGQFPALVDVLLHYFKTCFVDDPRPIKDEPHYFIQDHIDTIQDLFYSQYKRDILLQIIYLIFFLN